MKKQNLITGLLFIIASTLSITFVDKPAIAGCADGYYGRAWAVDTSTGKKVRDYGYVRKAECANGYSSVFIVKQDKNKELFGASICLFAEPC